MNNPEMNRHEKKIDQLMSLIKTNDILFEHLNLEGQRVVLHTSIDIVLDGLINNLTSMARTTESLEETVRKKREKNNGNNE